MAKKKVVISACLLGERCRYDGKTKKVDNILENYKDYEVIPFCPEAPIFGTPRERISVVKVDNQHRIITYETKKDVTKLLHDEIYNFIKKNPDIDAILLKSKSPSCGVGTAPVLSLSGEILSFGNGIATQIFTKEYKDITIEENS